MISAGFISFSASWISCPYHEQLPFSPKSAFNLPRPYHFLMIILELLLILELISAQVFFDSSIQKAQDQLILCLLYDHFLLSVSFLKFSLS